MTGEVLLVATFLTLRWRRVECALVLLGLLPSEVSRAFFRHCQGDNRSYTEQQTSTLAHHAGLPWIFELGVSVTLRPGKRGQTHFDSAQHGGLTR